MASKTLRIATRNSPLALWQAEFVKDQLENAHQDLQVELIPMKTRGDVLLDTPLAKVGGKGLFVKELEVAMLEGRADIAVHSMKDVPVAFPDGLGLSVICQREDPRDAFVSNRYADLDALPQGAVLGTCSLRRQAQARARRPDLVIENLRGNVNSRLAKLDAGQFDAILLAASGLMRLGFETRIRDAMDPQLSLPAVGQGALGIECRNDDQQTLALLQVLDHRETHIRVTAERAMNECLQGGCQVPIAGYAELAGNQLWLRGLVAEPDGSQVVYHEVNGHCDNAEALGWALGDYLLKNGARQILDRLYQNAP